FPVLERAGEQRNQSEILDPKTGKQMLARFVFERAEPAPLADAAAVLRQRFDLSERIRQGSLFAVVEIGADVLDPKPALNSPAAAALPPDASLEQQLDAAEALTGEAGLIRYTSNQPTYSELTGFLQRTLPQEIYIRRLRTAALPADKVLPL